MPPRSLEQIREAVRSSAEPRPRATYTPRSTRLLASNLRQVQRGRSIEQIRRAQQIAKGGSPSVGARILTGVAGVLGAPLRGVVASLEEVGEEFAGKEDEQSWWENVSDVNYGVGKVLERAAPDANIWAKRIGGFTGDVLLDPLTYLTFGAAPALKAAGKGTGLARIAIEGAEYADEIADVARLGGKLDDAANAVESATRLRGYADRATRGAKLTRDEYDDIASATRMMADDANGPMIDAIKEGALGYGVSLRLPFGNGPSMRLTDGRLVINRMQDGFSAAGRTVRATKVGEWLNGNTNSIKRLIDRGGYENVRNGVRLLDAVKSGKVAQADAERQLSGTLRDLVRRSKKAGLNGEELYDVLGQRAVGDNAGGEAWRRLMAEGGERADLARAWGAWLDSVPEWAAEQSRYGNARFNWLPDASRGGRPYVPRVLSDEFAEVARTRLSTRTKVGERAWFERKAHGIGDEFGDRELVNPGQITDNYPQGAPALEEQMADGARAMFGEEAVDLFERDLFKAVGKYQQGVATQVRNYKIQNYLRAKGISDDLVEWTYDDAGKKVRVRDFNTKVQARLDSITNRDAGKLKRIAQLGEERDRLTAQVAAGEMDAGEFRSLVSRLDQEREVISRELDLSIEDANKANRELAHRQRLEDQARDALDADEAALAEAKALRDSVTRDIEAQLAPGRAATANVEDLVRRRDEANAIVQEAATAPTRVAGLYRSAVNGEVIASEIERRLAAGEAIGPGDPFYNVIRDVAERSFPGADPSDVAPEVAKMLRAASAEDMADLAQYGRRYPSSADLQTVHAEWLEAAAQREAAEDAMLAATDEASFATARQAYEEATAAQAERRVVLTLHREASGGPRLADMDQAAVQAMRDGIEASRALTAGMVDPGERAAASLANAVEQWPETAGGGRTWLHGAQDFHLDAEGRFSLEDALRDSGQRWRDDLFAPTPASGPRVMADPEQVAQAMDSVAPDRAMVFGPGQTFASESARRLYEEAPELLDRALASAPKQVQNTYALARQVQEQATARGFPILFDDALEIAGAHMGARRTAKTFPWDDLESKIHTLPGVNELKPNATRLSATLFREQVPTAVRDELFGALGQSFARQADAVLFYSGRSTQVLDAILDQVPEVGARQALGDVVEQSRRAYTGKVIGQRAYDEFMDTLAEADSLVRSTANMVKASNDDLIQAQAATRAAKTVAAQAAARQEGDLNRLYAKAFALRDAEEALKAREALLDPEAKMVATLRAREREMEAAIYDYELGAERSIWDGHARRAEEAMRHVLHDGWDGFGFGRQAPESVIEALRAVERTYDRGPNGTGAFLRTWDQMNTWIKSWLTASPGFQWRNMMGGTFNNWLADVNIRRSTTGWTKAFFRNLGVDPRTGLGSRPGLAKALEQPTAWDRATFTIANRLGVLGSGLFHSEIGDITKPSWNLLAGLRPGSTSSFVLPYYTKRAGESFVEPILRGTLAFDRVLKSVERGRFASMGVRSVDDITEANLDAFTEAVLTSPLADEIVDDIFKYHFDYDDLAGFERNVMRRIIPFYTWMRKNVPLQIEAMMTQPGKAINRFMALKRNIELGTEEEPIVPSYFAEQMFTRLPWQSGGHQLYGTLDMPFGDPFEAADVTGQFVGSLNPFIKAPLEALVGGEQFKTGVPITPKLEPAPGTWAKVPGLMLAWQAAANVMPFLPLDPPVKQDGQWYVRQKDAYLVEQYLPFMSRARRLLPMWDTGVEGGSKFQKRHVSTMLSYLAGVNLRTNTPQDMESEIFRRSDRIEAIVNDLEATGQIEPRRQRRERRQRTGSLGAALSTVGTIPG